jgi:hypothetical protein
MASRQGRKYRAVAERWRLGREIKKEVANTKNKLQI